MKCKDCPYYWQDNDEEHMYCHYHYDDGYAPCEVDEKEDTNNDAI